jgi:hypothetical protein
MPASRRKAADIYRISPEAVASAVIVLTTLGLLTPVIFETFSSRRPRTDGL